MFRPALKFTSATNLVLSALGYFTRKATHETKPLAVDQECEVPLPAALFTLLLETGTIVPSKHFVEEVEKGVSSPSVAQTKMGTPSEEIGSWRSRIGHE